jgi:hypothetical protein
MIKGAHIDKLVDQLYGQSNIGTGKNIFLLWDSF